MSKKQKSSQLQVVVFVEGDTDEVFFKSLLDYYRSVSHTELRPCRICNLRGVTRYSSKLLAKLQNEILPDAQKKGYKIQAICCTYDTDVFEVRNPLIVDWGSLQKKVRRMGIEQFIRLEIKSSIEDWILGDIDGVCQFLSIAAVPKMLKGNRGNEKLNDLFNKARKTYQKGYQTKELMAMLDMGAIRNKNADGLATLESALGVTINTTQKERI